GAPLPQGGPDVLAKARGVAAEGAARQGSVAHSVPSFEQHPRQRQVLADGRPGIVPVHHRLEVPLEVGPTDLPAVHGHLVVGTPPGAAAAPVTPSPSRAVSPTERRAWMTKVAAAQSQQRPPASFQPGSSTFLTSACRTASTASVWAGARAVHR